MNFQIMQHVEGRKFIPAIDPKTNKPFVYDNAKEAAFNAALLTAEKGLKFQPRPVKVAADWRDRERKRFTAGEYTTVLWADENWWKNIPDHFAHIGVKDKTRIAFTPDAVKGEADRQTAMLPGKYLQQFFADVLTKQQIRTYAMQHATKFEDNELKWARTVEEIEHVYKVGPSCSCFKGTTKANLYASGDFAVAYLQDTTGRITARALCAPERGVYVYAYGDDNRLAQALKKAGYELSTQSRDYAGLRLLRKWMWDGYYADWYPRRNYHEDPNNPEFLIVEE